MALERREYRAYAIVQTCEKCKEGYYEFDKFAPVLCTYPAQYSHRCDRCGDVKTFFEKYPKIEYEILEKE